MQDRFPLSTRARVFPWRWIGWTCVVLLVVACAWTARAVPWMGAAEDWRSWLGALGWRGPAVYAGIYVLATIALVPGSAVTLLGGAAFGVVKGFVIVSLASTTGAAAAFLIARFIARPWVVRLAEKYPWFRAVDRAIDVAGWKMVALLRLSPLVPFNVQNYLLGLTAIGFWPYVMTSWIAMWPGTFLYVYLGHLAGLAIEAPRGLTAWRWLSAGVGLAATVAVTVVLGRLASAQLREEAGLAAGDRGGKRAEAKARP